MTDIFMDDLQFIKENLLSMDIEICGNIFELSEYKEKYKNTEFEHLFDHYRRSRGVLWYDIRSQMENSRLDTCNHNYGSKIMFHTHSHLSKFYPSIQDIIKYIFTNETQTNLIFTTLGIWEFKPISNVMYNIRKNDEERYRRNKRRFTILLNKKLEEIYRKTYRGRIENIPNDKKQYVKEYLKNVFNIDICNNIFQTAKFTPWDEIQNYYIVF